MTVEVLPPEKPVPGLLAHCGAELLSRQDLLVLPTPEGSATHRPIPHAEVVQALIETLGYRRLTVLQDQYAVTPNGMRMFGVLVLDLEEKDVRISIALRNSHDKSFALALTVGYKVLVCDNLAFHGDFTPVVKKHSKKLVLEDVIAMAVEKMQRNFAPMIRQVDAWRDHSLPDVTAKSIIYDAFIRGKLEAPKHLASEVDRQYFEPQWSLSNAFTSAFKQLDAVPQFKATAKLAPFLAEFGRDH
jgi:hypothetical protein